MTEQGGNDDEQLEGEPTLHETIEFSLAVSLDLENNLDEDESPFEQVVNININCGHLLCMCYAVQGLYQKLEEMSDEDMDALEEYVRVKKRSPTNSSLMH